MKKSELKQLIREEIQKMGINKLTISEGISDSFRVRKLIDTIHHDLKSFRKIKGIDKKLTDNLFKNFTPLFHDLDRLASYLERTDK